MATIQGVYVALFGRPADPTGLAYFNTATNNGGDLTKIGDLASTQEYKDRFAGQNNVQIVSAIYQSLFNRAPEATGLNFFVNALNTGSLNINNIAIAILDGAQGSDKTIVDAKIASANTFTSRLDTAVEIGNYVGNAAAAQGRAFLADVTTTPKTAAQADTAITNLSVGNTITLTAAVADTVSLTAADGFKSTNSDDTINALTATQFGSGDSIDGGLGVDTLNVLNAAAGTVTPLKLASVEKIFYAQTGADGGLALTNATGVMEVWNKASGNALAVSDVTLGTTVGLEGTVVGAASFAFKAASVTGTADAATLALKGATGAVTIDSIETLNVATSGTASTVSIAGTTVKDVKISGDIGGSLTFTSTTVKSVDASAVNGSGVSINVAAATDGVKVTGSKFAETITLNNTGLLTTDKDVIVYNAGNISTATQKDTVTNFTAGEDKIDLSAFALTGGKAAATTFGAAPVEGASFLGNATAFHVASNTFYADTNNDGVYNAATDFQVTLTGATGIAVADIIFTA